VARGGTTYSTFETIEEGGAGSTGAS